MRRSSSTSLSHPARIALALLVLSSIAVLPAEGAPFATYASDLYEADAGDDTWATAQSVTGALSSATYGSPAATQSRTFDLVDDGTGECDEDWISFTVSASDVDVGKSYLIEAVGIDSAVDPVIELYGPGSANPTTPTALLESVETSGVTETDPAATFADDDGAWFSHRSASLSFVPAIDGAGMYWVRIRPYYQYAGGPDEGYRSGVGRYTLRLKTWQMTRLAGADRIATAIAVSRERFNTEGPASRSVVLANGYNFPDALAGSTLAGALQAPMLLTDPEELSPGVESEIQRLGADTVYVLGGTGAIGAAVAQTLEDSSLEVTRVAGAGRAETARLIAEKAAEVASTSPVAFVANSKRFPDALSASPMAAFNVVPILLTPEEALDPQVTEALDSDALGITDVVIVGGTAAVPAAIESALRARLGTDHVRRIAGADRFATSRDVGLWATGVTDDTERVGTIARPDALDTLAYNRVGVASGRNFPDALAGGVFCGLAGSPVLLTEPDRVPEPIMSVVPPIVDDYWFASDLAILRSYVFGGSAAVSSGVLLQLDVFTG